jgi:hypothetical protein
MTFSRGAAELDEIAVADPAMLVRFLRWRYVRKAVSAALAASG